VEGQPEPVAQKCRNDIGSFLPTAQRSPGSAGPYRSCVPRMGMRVVVTPGMQCICCGGICGADLVPLVEHGQRDHDTWKTFNQNNIKQFHANAGNESRSADGDLPLLTTRAVDLVSCEQRRIRTSHSTAR
jgi:hypothetical protein